MLGEVTPIHDSPPHSGSFLLAIGTFRFAVVIFVENHKIGISDTENAYESLLRQSMTPTGNSGS